MLFFTEQILKADFRAAHESFFAHSSLFMTTANVVKHYGLKGPVSGYSSACSAGQTSIAEAYNTIKENEANVMIAGSSDHGIHPYLLKGLSRLGALEKHSNAAPEAGSRPFDKSRAGLVAADGAGVLVLEELEHALHRGAKVYAEVLGVAMNSEAFHLTRPDGLGDGIYRTMRDSLQRAGVQPSDVNVVHSHGTATTEGDLSEARAIHRLFGDSRPYIFSVKSNVGHMMAGVGGIQAGVLVMALCEDLVPAILNLKDPLELGEVTLNFAREAVRTPLQIGVSNNAGFGGLNSTLVFSKFNKANMV